MSPKRRRSFAAITLFVWLTSAIGLLEGAWAGQIRLLLLSGRNNHDWKTTTPALKKMYEDSGRFAVDVTDDPASCDAATFAKYDVIVSNWSGFPDMDQRQWGAKSEQAFLDFVRGGKGFALFHAASASFRTWPEFQQLIGATWGKDTGHGSIHAFKVTISDPAHPVTQGMKDFWITDELWHRMQAHPERHVLCTAFSAQDNGGSGKDEPVVLCTQLGKGRGYNLVLGHDTNTMQNIAWQTLMLRGTEWAATGKVTIPLAAQWPSTPAAAGLPGMDPGAALKSIAGYTFGQSRKDLGTVEGLTYAAGSDPALRSKLAPAMAKMLASDATVDAKKFLCGQLSLTGRAEEVPALAALLGDKELSLAARSALQRIPGDAPLAAMRAELDRAAGPVAIGLINTLGERADPKAVDVIAKHLTDADKAVAGASIDALGKIGSPAAAKALSDARGKLPDELRPGLANALLQCAEGLLAAGNAAEARAIYEQLSAAGNPKHVRIAAFPGLVACQKENAPKLLQEALASKDPALQAAAIRCARKTGDTSLTRIFSDQLPGLPPAIQVQMVDALADRGDAAALPAVIKAAEGVGQGTGSPVRLAAVAALGKLGKADTVSYLAGLACQPTGAERQVARNSLIRLQGRDIDSTMIGLLEKAEPPVRQEMILALNARGARTAVPALLRAAEDSDPSIRKEAIRALSNLAGPENLPALMKILLSAKSDTERPDVESALIAACRRAASVEQAAAAVVASMPTADAPQRISLLRVLGQLGGEPSLKAIRGALKDGNADVRSAAIRALANWSDGSVLEDLLAVAGSAQDLPPKVLALRGFAELSGKAKDRPPEQLTKLFAEALKIAPRAEEKKALLSALGKVQCLQAMQLAAAQLGDAEVANEAGLATVQIADAVWRYHLAEAKPLMRTIADSTQIPAVKERAEAVLVAMSKPVNLAIGATATSPDGLEKDGAASGDQAAIDGDPNTYWDEEDNKALYRLNIALKAPVDVSAISILGFQQHSYAPKDFEILCDDKVVKTVRGAAYDNNRLIVAFPRTRCQTLELKITGYYGSSPAIRELEIYNADPAK